MSEIGVEGWNNCKGLDPEYFIQAGRSYGHLYGMNGGEIPYFQCLLNERDFIEAYRVCPPLKAIISRRAKAFNNGIKDVFNGNTDKPARGHEAASIRAMLEKPNVLQTGDQFFSQQNQYIDLFGYCPVLVIRPSGFVDEIKAVWNIPPWLFDIKYTRKWLNQYKLTGIYEKFYILWEGKQMEIDVRDIKFIFDDGIGSEDDTNLVIPDSRLVGMDYIVSNICAAYKSRNTLITKRGAMGVLSNDSTDAKGSSLAIEEEVKKDLQRDFKSYGIVGQPFQIILTDAKMKWQQMGFATKELMLFEEIQDDIDRLCDQYGYPSELISRIKGTTYENKLQARIDMYHDSIVPEDKSRMQQFTNCIVSEGSGLIIKTDYSKVPVLQREKKIHAEARLLWNQAMKIEKDNGVSTRNEWRIKLGEEPIPKEIDPTADEYKETIVMQSELNSEEKDKKDKKKKPPIK
jgi:hypothetical protein